MLEKCQKSLVLPMKSVSVCTFKTSSFVPAPRAHMLKHVCAWCRYTRGRFERTHGDVLSGHTEFLSVSHDTPQHNTTQQHDHNTTRRQRQRQTETDRDRERREDGRGETRQEKRRQKKTRQARDLSLPNSVKYDSSLIFFSAPWQVNSFLISANYLFCAVTVFHFFGYAVTVSNFSELFSYAATVFFFARINSA